MTTRSWVLVAESSRAKLYEAKTKAAPLVEIADYVHPEARLPQRELITDGPGEDTGGSPGLGPHMFDDEVSPKEEEAIRFAEMLAEELEKGRVARKFDQLILVAPPKFMGYLREKLSPELKAMIGESIDKNLTREKPEVIRKHLQTLL